MGLPFVDRLGRDSSLVAAPRAVRLPEGRSGTTGSAGGSGGAQRRGRSTQPVERVQPAARPEGLQLGDAHGLSLPVQSVNAQRVPATGFPRETLQTSLCK